MLPYLEPLSVGPVSSFSILAVLGMFFAVAAGSRHAERLGLDARLVRRMATFCGVGTLLGAHYVDLFLYQPGWSEKDGAVWTFLNPFSGISSYGGLLGGTLGFLVFSRVYRVKRLRYADAGIVGAVVMMTFGRAGCASVHDHVGVASKFPLAVDFPAGNPAGVIGPHHDLGLYEFALVSLLLIALAFLLRRPRRPGWLVAVIALSYAVPRFFLDFLRREATDPRYHGLTPAQWGCIATATTGVLLLIWIYTHRESVPARFQSATPWKAHLRAAFRPSP